MNNKTNFRLSRPARIALGYAAAAALWIWLSDGLVAALVPDPGTQLAVQSWKGTGFVLVTTLVLYALLRTPAPESPQETAHGLGRHGAVLLGLTFLLLAALIAGLGALAWQQQAVGHKLHQQRQQTAIAELKTEQVARWLFWHRQDAELLGRDAALHAAAAWLAAPPRPGARPPPALADAEAHLRALVASGRWAAAGLYAADGRPLLVVGGIAPPAEAIAAAAREGDFRLHDAAALDVQMPHIDFLLPLEAAAVLALSADPRKSLWPMVQSWPLPSQSSEVLLLRADKDAVVYLTPPRPGGAQPPRQALTDARSVAVRAVLHGPGHHEGLDERGAEVIAACETVPGTTWHVVAKTDVEELMQPLRRQGGQMLALVLLAIGLAGAFVAYLWRNRQAAQALRERRALVERDALARKLETLFDQARDAILLIDPDGRIVEVNAAACALYGYTAEEFRRLHIRDLRAPDTLDELPGQFAASARPEGVLFETGHRRRDGSPIAVEVSSRGIEIDGKLYRQSIIRDISARRQAEQTIRRQLDELRRWHEVTLDREGRVAELKAEVNALRQRLGEPPRYGVSAPEDAGGEPQP